LVCPRFYNLCGESMRRSIVAAKHRTPLIIRAP
jgi:hypothetical protein